MQDADYDALDDVIAPMNPDEVLAFLLPLAESGNAAAQCLLADAYDLADVGPRDSVQAVHWYRQAAAQGFMRAEYFLGSMLASGIGTERDVAEAIHWMRIVADKGDSAAQYSLAELLLVDGSDDAVRVAEAIAWLTLSAAQGNELAIVRLATLRKQRLSSVL
ncbi:MAG TPA: tetratricopeptide repeat protein [Telluria sp.]|jgi:hypothetical protein